MKYRNYDIDITVNDSTVEMLPSEFSFSLRDNIFSLMPEATFDVNDSTGLFTEFQMFADGTPMHFSFGFRDEYLDNSFIVNFNEVREVFNSEYLNGKITITLLHFFENIQERLSKSYSGTPSNVLSELLSDVPFNGLDIESSVNTRTWYRPLLTQEEFIEEILLENVYSNNSNNTPFFSFIDSNNVFHFKSFYSMMEQTPIKELIYFPNSYSTAVDGKIFEFLPFTDSFSKVYPYLNIKSFYDSKDSLELTEIERKITEVYPQPNGYPIIREDDLLTNYDFAGDLNKISDRESIARQLFFIRRGLLPQKALIITNFDPRLLAGKTVDLAIASAAEPNSESISFSGKYLIEKSDHVWNGENQVGTTQLVVSRKGMKLTSDYLVKDRFYNP